MRKIIILSFITSAFLANVSAQLVIKSSGEAKMETNSQNYKLTVEGDTYVIGNILLGSTSKFLGTTNSDASVIFRVNNALAGTTGSSSKTNVSFGYQAFNNALGVANVAVGIQSLYSTETGGDNNTATGYRVLYSNTNGKNNTANGRQSLYSNKGGSYNTANGAYALYFNEEGNYNTASGVSALYSNKNGNYNTANGYQSLNKNTTGIYNTANGAWSLTYNEEGNYNTANGVWALQQTTSNSNTANGYQALMKNTTGCHNTASGRQALYLNIAGNNNTANGFFALYSNKRGHYNTVIGYCADVGDTCLYNATAIGYNAVVDSSYHVRIGNNFVKKIGGYVSWTTYPSDGRAKKNIRSNVPGLNFINRLQPVTYNLNLDVIDELQRSDDPRINHFRDSVSMARTPEEKEIEAKARANKENQVYSGFIAQDVEEAARSIGYDFSGVDAVGNGKGIYGIRYAEFVVPLAKAVQELSEQNNAKDAAIASLQEQVNELKGLVNRLLGKDSDSGTLGSEK